MIKSRSRWVIDVLEVKKRKLEWITSSKREALEKLSRMSPLTRLEPAAVTATNWNNAAAALPGKKSVTMRGGRKRIASEQRRFHLMGCAVDEQFHKFEPAFKLLRELKIIDSNCDLNARRSELAKHYFTPKEIEAVLQARTPRGAAKRFIAKSLTSHKHPNGLSMQTINSCYSRYLKALKSKRTLL